MKILLASYSFFPNTGGIETITFILAKEFVCNGHEVTIITCTPLGKGTKEADLDCTILRNPSITSLFSAYIWSDVVLQIHLSLRLLWPILLVRRPLLVSLQTWIGSSYRVLKNFFLKRCSFVISCSNSIRHTEWPNSLVIGNPYDNSLFKRIDGLTQTRTIVFVGRLVEGKGADLLIRSFATIDTDYSLLIIGEGPQLTTLKSIASAYSLEHNINFAGCLRGIDLARTLNQCQVMVVPSVWKEPFGIVALEGLACGCKLVVADDCGLVDAVPISTQKFKRNNIDDLASKLKLIINNNARSYDDETQQHLLEHTIQSVSNKYLTLLSNAYRQRGKARKR